MSEAWYLNTQRLLKLIEDYKSREVKKDADVLNLALAHYQAPL